MTPRFARAMLAVAFPLPAGFMPLWVWVPKTGAHLAVPSIPCLVDDHAPDVGMFAIQPYNGGRSVVIGSPRAWALNGARNLAEAYRPESLP